MAQSAHGLLSNFALHLWHYRVMADDIGLGCCSICHEMIERDDGQAALCGHMFHVECYTHYLQVVGLNASQARCPVCRMDGPQLQNGEEDLLNVRANDVESVHSDPISSDSDQDDAPLLPKAPAPLRRHLLTLSLIHI